MSLCLAIDGNVKNVCNLISFYKQLFLIMSGNLHLYFYSFLLHSRIFMCINFSFLLNVI